MSQESREQFNRKMDRTVIWIESSKGEDAHIES